MFESPINLTKPILRNLIEIKNLNRFPPANSVFAAPAPQAAGPFGAPFGFTSQATDTTSTNVFGVPTSTTQSAFGTGPSFTQQQQPQTTNVFGQPITAASNNSPFGGSSFAASPFGGKPAAAGGNSVFGVTVTLVIDETAYSLDNCLTDDEKAVYKLAQFEEGRIPLKPPTKELR